MNVEKFKEIIDNLDDRYYKERNEQIEKEIDNIMNGRPRFEGIKDISGLVVPQSKIEAEIKKLEIERRSNERLEKELRYVLSKLDFYSFKLENIVEEQFLLKQLRKLISSRNYFEIDKTKAFQENNNKYKKIYNKSNKKLEHIKNKISKKIYKLLKFNNRLSRLKVDKQKNLGRVLKDNKIRLLDGYSIANTMSNQFKTWDLSTFGVDVESINYALQQMKKEYNYGSLDLLKLYGEENFFEKLNVIRSFKGRICYISGGYRTLLEIENKYKEIMELSKEIWYIEEILKAFVNTEIVNSEMYQGLKRLMEQQEKYLGELIQKMNIQCKETGLQAKIDAEIRLQELCRSIENLKQQIQQNEKNNEFYRLKNLKEKYYNLTSEMTEILKDNPELNRPEYNIDNKSIIKDDVEDIKAKTEKEENILNLNNTYEVEIKSNVQKLNESKEEETETKKVSYTEEFSKISNIILESELQIHRTMYYQSYMREKVMNSELGKLPFSQYLETVAPHLKKLIDIEKRREKLASTIYKEYLKYYASLQNKQEALSFYNFAEQNYGIDNIDVPAEQEENYKGMKL